MAQIELGIEGARICICNGYVPEIIRTRDGYVPARIRTRDGYVPARILTHDEYVHVTALRNVEASRPAYRRTICLLSAYDQPASGVRLACYRGTIGLLSEYDRLSAYDAYNCL